MDRFVELGLADFVVLNEVVGELVEFMQGRDFESLDVGGILVGEVEGNEREEELRLFYLGKEGPLHQGVRVVVLGVKYYIGHCFLVLNDVLQVVDVK